MIPVERGIAAALMLVGAGMAAGIFSIWIFRRFADREKLRAAANRVLAHLLEFRLFADEPALVLRAQRAMLAANMRLLRVIAVPSLILFAPFALLFVTLDAVFAHAPLAPGKPAIVTLQWRNGRDAVARLQTPEGIRVDSPPVRIPDAREVSWRIRPVRAASGELGFQHNGVLTSKTVAAGSGFAWISPTRSRLNSFLVQPFERPLTDPALASITVSYPPATVLRVHWLVWFSIGSFASIFVWLISDRIAGSQQFTRGYGKSRNWYSRLLRGGN